MQPAIEPSYEPRWGQPLTLKTTKGFLGTHQFCDLRLDEGHLEFSNSAI